MAQDSVGNDILSNILGEIKQNRKETTRNRQATEDAATADAAALTPPSQKREEGRERAKKILF